MKYLDTVNLVSAIYISFQGRFKGTHFSNFYIILIAIIYNIVINR